MGNCYCVYGNAHNDVYVTDYVYGYVHTAV